MGDHQIIERNLGRSPNRILRLTHPVATPPEQVGSAGPKAAAGFGHNFADVRVHAESAAAGVGTAISIQRSPDDDLLGDLVDDEAAGPQYEDFLRRLGVRRANQRFSEGARSGTFEAEDIDAALDMPADTMAEAQDRIPSRSLPGEWGDMNHTAGVKDYPDKAGDPDLIRPTEQAKHKELTRGQDFEDGEPEGDLGMQEVDEDLPDGSMRQDAAEQWLQDNDPNYVEPGESNYSGTTGDEAAEGLAEGGEAIEEGAEGLEVGAEALEGAEAVGEGLELGELALELLPLLLL